MVNLVKLQWLRHQLYLQINLRHQLLWNLMFLLLANLYHQYYLRKIIVLIRQLLKLDLPKNPQQPDAALSGDNKSDTAQQKPRANKKASAQGHKRPTQKIRNNKKPGKPSREQRGNEHNDNSGPTTSMRAEDGQSAPSKKRRKRRSKPNTRQQPHDRQSTRNNGKGDDQGGERTPRRRRRNAA